jgi:hypothetical protein
MTPADFAKAFFSLMGYAISVVFREGLMEFRCTLKRWDLLVRIHYVIGMYRLAVVSRRYLLLVGFRVAEEGKEIDESTK